MKHRRGCRRGIEDDVVLAGRILRHEEGRIWFDVETVLGAPGRGLMPPPDRGEAEQTLRPGRDEVDEGPSQ